MMRVVILGSGSRGNAVVVESAGHRVLVDAGFSCRELERRMRLVGVDPATLQAVLLTHEHADHVVGVDRLVRRYNLPLFATAGTLDGTKLSLEARRLARRLESGVEAEAAGFVVEPFTIPHDAAEPIGLTLEDEAGHRVGLAADLGMRSRLAWARLMELDVLILEANHDLEMLRSGPYPWPLKQRIASAHGHLSNREAAEGIPELLCERLHRVVLYHLSQTNNLPALAFDAVAAVLSAEGSPAEITVAAQDQPTPWLEVA